MTDLDTYQARLQNQIDDYRGEGQEVFITLMRLLTTMRANQESMARTLNELEEEMDAIRESLAEIDRAIVAKAE